MKQLESAREVISALGGNDAVEAMTGRDYKTVCGWGVKDRFPPETYVLMTAELAAYGFTAPPSLWRQIERPEESQEEEAVDA